MSEKTYFLGVVFFFRRTHISLRELPLTSLDTQSSELSNVRAESVGRVESSLTPSPTLAGEAREVLSLFPVCLFVCFVLFCFISFL